MVALQPQNPVSHLFPWPCARRPPAPPAVLMRCRLGTAQGRVRLSFEYSNDLGLYAHVIFALDATGYACLSVFVCCRCGLRARVRDPSFVCAARIVAFERLELGCPVDLEAHLRYT